MFKPIEYRRSKFCLILYIALFLPSCFRVGIPERFYSYELTDSSNSIKPVSTISSPKIFISIPSRNDTYGINKDKSSYNLGHQFVLGIFPFTTLYLEHGPESFYVESLIQYYHSIGYSPIVVSSKLAKSLNCSSVEISGELDLTVYDLIFSRLIDFSGTAQVNDSKIGLVPIELSSSELYSQAQFPLLAHLLQQAMSSAYAKSDLEQLRANCRNVKINSSLNPVLLGFPRVGNLPSELLAEFARTYGDNLGVFSSSMLARVVQRGAELAIEPIAEPIALASNFGDFKAFESFVEIDMSLVDISLGESLKLTVDYRVTTNKITKNYRCLTTEVIDRSRDGALVVALEKGAQSNLSALLLKKPKICETQ